MDEKIGNIFSIHISQEPTIVQVLPSFVEITKKSQSDKKISVRGAVSDNEFQNDNEICKNTTWISHRDIRVGSMSNRANSYTRPDDVRGLYSSLNYMNNLVNCSTKVIKKMAMNVLAIDFEMKGNIKSGFYVLAIVLVNVLFSLPMNIIPQYDVLKFPEYWLKHLLISYAAVTIVYVTFHHYDQLLVLNSENAISVKNLFYLWIGIFSIPVLTTSAVHIFWIYILDYRPPVPFTGSFSIMIAFIVLCMIFWFQHPSSLRSNQSFRRRLKWYISTRIISMCISQGYIAIDGLFEKIPTQLQPILAFVLPVIKYGSSKVLMSMTEKARGQNKSSARFAAICKVSFAHALSLAIIVGSSATFMTAFLISCTDVALSIKSCFGILRLYKLHGYHTGERIDKMVQGLVMKDTFELLLPIIYCMILSMSYHGPNAEILGNVKNDYWQYSKIDDIVLLLSKIGIFLCVDLLRVIFNTFVLWKWCKISLISEFCQMMQTYWKAIAMYLAFYLVTVS